MKIIRALIASLAITLALAQFAYGSNWPMNNCDAQNSGFNSAETIVCPPLEFAWNKNPDYTSYEKRTRPVIADGVVYSGQTWSVYEWGNFVRKDGQLQAISLLSGQPIWTLKGVLVSGAPALSNGRIYVGTTDGKFCSFNAKDGSTVWQVAVNGAPTAPVVFGHMVYFSTSTNRLYALHADSGAVQWVTERQSYVTSPAVTNDAVFVGGSELLAIDPSSGQIKWSFYGKRSHSVPIAHGKSVFVSSIYELFCFDADSGQVKWSRYTGDSYGASRTPVVAGSTLYVGSVRAFDIDTGNVRWVFDGQNQYHGASVAVANGYVFVGSTRRDEGFFDNSDGRLYVLNAGTGELVWQFLAGRRLNDWYLIDPSPAVADGSVVLNLSTGQFSCFYTPIRSYVLGVTTSKNKINPYDPHSGNVDFRFSLTSPAIVTVDVLDNNDKLVRRLIYKKDYGAGEHVVTWHCLIEFPEMADPGLKAQFNDQCILMAPDGTYKALITAEQGDGKTFTGSADVEVEAQI